MTTLKSFFKTENQMGGLKIAEWRNFGGGL